MMRDVGLIQKWESQFDPDTSPCYFSKKQQSKKQNGNNSKLLIRLTLKNLGGAFVVLMIGCLSALLIFGTEIIIHLVIKKFC